MAAPFQQQKDKSPPNEAAAAAAPARTPVVQPAQSAISWSSIELAIAGRVFCERPAAEVTANKKLAQESVREERSALGARVIPADWRSTAAQLRRNERSETADRLERAGEVLAHLRDGSLDDKTKNAGAAQVAGLASQDGLLITYDGRVHPVLGSLQLNQGAQREELLIIDAPAESFRGYTISSSLGVVNAADGTDAPQALSSRTLQAVAAHEYAHMKLLAAGLPGGNCPISPSPVAPPSFFNAADTARVNSVLVNDTGLVHELCARAAELSIDADQAFSKMATGALRRLASETADRYSLADTIFMAAVENRERAAGRKTIAEAASFFAECKKEQFRILSELKQAADNMDTIAGLQRSQSMITAKEEKYIEENAQRIVNDLQPVDKEIVSRCLRYYAEACLQRCAEMKNH